MKHNKRFAHWLADARRAAHLTQAKLAEYLDVSQTTISYWEEIGRLSMTPEEIRDLAALLRVPAVEVAEALGYPTREAEATSRPPLTPDQWIGRVATLSEATVRAIEAWAEETYPVGRQGRAPEDRSG